MSIEDLMQVARAIYSVGERETYEGKQAIGAVVQNWFYGNRRELRGETLAATVNMKREFPLLPDINTGHRPIDLTSPTWKDCVLVARQVLTNSCPDRTNGCTHFARKETSGEIFNTEIFAQERYLVGSYVFAREKGEEEMTGTVHISTQQNSGTHSTPREPETHIIDYGIDLGISCCIA